MKLIGATLRSNYHWGLSYETARFSGLLLQIRYMSFTPNPMQKRVDIKYELFTRTLFSKLRNYFA